MPPPAQHEQYARDNEPNPTFTIVALATHKAVLRHHYEHAPNLNGVHSPTFAYWQRLGRNLIAYLRADQTGQDPYH